jgi:hypothetical protein
LRDESPGYDYQSPGLTLKLDPLSNLMFKMLFLLCFSSGGKSKTLKLLGFTRSRVLALPGCHVGSWGKESRGIPRETLEMWHKPYFKQNFLCSKWLA